MFAGSIQITPSIADKSGAGSLIPAFVISEKIFVTAPRELKLNRPAKFSLGIAVALTLSTSSPTKILPFDNAMPPISGGTIAPRTSESFAVGNWL